MKLDKETIIVLVIGIIVLIGWDPLCKYMGWFQIPVPSSAPAAAAKAPAAPAAAPAPAAPKAVALQTAPKIKPVTLQSVTIENKELKAVIDPANGSVTEFILPGYFKADRKNPIRFFQGPQGAFAFGEFDPALRGVTVSAQVIPGKGVDTAALVRQVAFPDGSSFVVNQLFQLKPGYMVSVSGKVTNCSKKIVRFTHPGIFGAQLLPWAKISGDKVRIPSHRLDYMTPNGKFNDIAADAKAEKFNDVNGTSVQWAGVGNKYFCILMDGNAPFMLKTFRKFITDGKESSAQVGFGAEFPARALIPGDSFEYSFNAYIGPKIIADVERFNSKAAHVMHLAWGPLDYLSRLLLWVLVKIHGMGLSYGWSIIVLTLIVRILFYPATAKANASMKKMSAVQPKMKEIKEKYKDNPQLMNAKMMELYRAEGVNPFGGCLPLLLQIPVFFALYATLDGAVELRQVPFLWCVDLAGPDTVANIPLIWFNLPVNPLVIVMTLLMVLQQHITPMSGDPMQRKMMMWMPVIMLLMFYDLPSGLTLYWSVSNVFSIIQLLIQKRSGNLAGTPPVPAKK